VSLNLTTEATCVRFKFNKCACVRCQVGDSEAAHGPRRRRPHVHGGSRLTRYSLHTSVTSNSPSVGLGGGSAHSSRDVRTANPEKEVDRPIASRAPTHNEYTELPASSKPHNGARTWGPEVRDLSQVPNSQTSANSNTVPVPV